MDDQENDYDRIANEIGVAIAMLTVNTYVNTSALGDYITVSKDGYINTIVTLQRLRGWVEGLATTHRNNPSHKITWHY